MVICLSTVNMSTTSTPSLSYFHPYLKASRVRRKPHMPKSHKKDVFSRWSWIISQLSIIIFWHPNHKKIFWTVLAPTYNRDLSSPLNIHVHAVVLLMMIIDVLFTKTPVHLIAFVYNSIYYLVYMIFTYSLHTAKITSEVYSFLNYKKIWNGF